MLCSLLHSGESSSAATIDAISSSVPKMNYLSVLYFICQFSRKNYTVEDS